MNKHIEDNGDLNILVNNNGAALIVCSECGNKWHGQFSTLATIQPFVRKNLKDDFLGNPELLENLNIDPEGFL